MPLRKRKGRRRAEPPSSAATKAVIEPEANVGKEGYEEEAVDPEAVSAGQASEASMDEEERRARETIALLAKKYQVKLTEEISNSLDIIQVDDSAEVEREDDEEDEKENKKTSKLVPKKRTKLQKQAEKGATPVFKTPRPLAHHSTPAPAGDRSLFGFENLDTPLTLSPVTTTPAGGTTSLEVGQRHSVEEEEERDVVKPSPYSRLTGTYDIPFKKKTPRRPAARKRKSTSGEECWAAQLNAQFSEIEQFELAVE